MLIYVDVDETICLTPESRDYSLSAPIKENIQKINELYDEGNTIIYWTARGTMTGIDWKEITESQFKRWGVKYHDLKFGKPAYDLFIDDKNVNSETFFQNNPLYSLTNDE
jgi:CMP-N,N'-diacetyllegionaminic acid synthase